MAARKSGSPKDDSWDLFTSEEWNCLEDGHRRFVIALAAHRQQLGWYSDAIWTLSVFLWCVSSFTPKEDVAQLRLTVFRDCYGLARKDIADAVAMCPNEKHDEHLDNQLWNDESSEEDFWDLINSANSHAAEITHELLRKATRECLQTLKSATFVIGITEYVRQSSIGQSLRDAQMPVTSAGSFRNLPLDTSKAGHAMHRASEALNRQEFPQKRGITAALDMTWELQELARVAILESVKGNTDTRKSEDNVEEQPSLTPHKRKQRERRELVRRLFEVEGLSMKEVAARIDMNPSTVYRDLKS